MLVPINSARPLRYIGRKFKFKFIFPPFIFDPHIQTRKVKKKKKKKKEEHKNKHPENKKWSVAHFLRNLNKERAQRSIRLRNDDPGVSILIFPWPA